jgi:hypothetical protein
MASGPGDREAIENTVRFKFCFMTQDAKVKNSYLRFKGHNSMYVKNHNLR